MTIIDALLTPNPYSRRQKPNVPKKIVVHYVGNPGSSAMGNRNYFEGLKVGTKLPSGAYRFASSHYIVGLKGEIIRCIPEQEEAIHASDSIMNVSSIGIEICHPDATGKFTEVTLATVVELCADICKRYNLHPLVDIIRHYDVPKSNFKRCPLWFVTHPEDFVAFKERVNKAVQPTPEEIKAKRIDETVLLLGSKKRKDGVNPISDSPETWRKAFNGEIPINLDNFITLLRRALGAE